MPGLVASLDIWATPPKMKRVIPLTGIPFLMATRLWLSSCATTETKSMELEARATPQRSGEDQDGRNSPRNTAREEVTINKARNQL
jgi:hypothetical protein